MRSTQAGSASARVSGPSVRRSLRLPLFLRDFVLNAQLAHEGPDALAVAPRMGVVARERITRDNARGQRIIALPGGRCAAGERKDVEVRW